VTVFAYNLFTNIELLCARLHAQLEEGATGEFRRDLSAHTTVDRTNITTSIPQTGETAETPDDIPEEFLMDAREMMIGDSVRASDVPLAGSMTVVSAPDMVLAHVVAVRTSVESAGEGEEEAEPEVVAKGKKEEEGEKK